MRLRAGHGFPSIPDLGARPPSQARPRPAVKFVLTNASFQCRTFGFADLDHLLGVRAGQLTPAGETAAAAPSTSMSEQLFEPSDCKTRILNNSTHSDRVHRIVSWNGDEVRAFAHYRVLALAHNKAFSNALITLR